MEGYKSATYVNSFKLTTTQTDEIHRFAAAASGTTTTVADARGFVQRLAVHVMYAGEVQLRIYGNFGVEGVAGSPLTAYTTLYLPRASSTSNGGQGEYVIEGLQIYGIRMVAGGLRIAARAP